MPVSCSPPPHVLSDLMRQLEAAGKERAAAGCAAHVRPAPVGALGDAATHEEYLRLALRVKVCLEPPQQSRFRVVAVIRYRDSAGVQRYVTGTNCESAGWIGNSLCAERSALSHLRMYDCAGVTAVYVVTDMLGSVVTPGLLCRENLMANLPPDMPVYMASAATPDGVDPVLQKRTTLGELLPHSDVYALAAVRDRMKPADTQKWAERFGGCCQRADAGLPEEVRPALAAARRCCSENSGDAWHPLQLGAAVLFEDGTVESSGQAKCVEYGNTVCPVSRLQELIERRRRRGVMPKWVLQCDQRGVLLAPYAPARAYLTEHGFGGVNVAAHGLDGRVAVAKAAQLAPDTPAWDGNSSQ